MSPQEKLIDKLTKLKNHAESAKAIGSEAEAQAFAEKVQQLLLEHDLQMSDIEFATLAVDEPVDRGLIDWTPAGIKGKKTRTQWMEQLAAMIARANFCQIIVQAGTSNIWLIGRKEHRAVAEYMIVTLTRAVIDISKKEHAKFSWEVYKRDGSTFRARGFKDSFITGFLFRLFQRIEERKKTAETSTSTALVRINREDAAVASYMEDMRKLPKKDPNHIGKGHGLTRSNPTNAEGVRRGRAAADKLDLGARAIDRNTTERRSIR